MKKIIYLTIALICLTNCRYKVEITGVHFYASEVYDDYPKETEFLNSELVFGTDFILNRGPVQAFVNVVFTNPVIEEKFILTSNQDFILTTNDTLKSGEDLMNYFEYRKIRDNQYWLSYNFRNTANFLNQAGYYRFYFTAHLSDNTEVSDSCLVKIHF